MKRRNKGDGSIYFDKTRNRFIASYYDKLNKRHVKRFKTKSEAREFLISVNSSLQTNTYISPTAITLGEWLLKWLTTYKKPFIKESSYTTYVRYAKHLEPLANIKLQSLTAPTIQVFFNKLEKTNNTKSEVYKILKPALTKAFALDIIPKNPILLVGSYKVERKEIETFSVKEINTIIKELPNLDIKQNRYSLFLLAITTGARIGELLALTWQDVDLSSNTIRINKSVQYINGEDLVSSPKTKYSKRVVNFPPSIAPALKKLYDEQKVISINQNTPLFQTCHGNYIRNSNIANSWHKILAALNMPYRKFHALRHTHATQLLADNVSPVEVSRRLGHADSTITLKVYAHVLPGSDKKIANKIDRYYEFKEEIQA